MSKITKVSIPCHLNLAYEGELSREEVVEAVQETMHFMSGRELWNFVQMIAGKNEQGDNWEIKTITEE